MRKTFRSSRGAIRGIAWGTALALMAIRISPPRLRSRCYSAVLATLVTLCSAGTKVALITFHASARAKVQILALLRQRIRNILRYVRSAHRIAKQRFRFRQLRISAIRSVRISHWPLRRALKNLPRNPRDARCHCNPKNVPKKPLHISHPYTNPWPDLPIRTVYVPVSLVWPAVYSTPCCQSIKSALKSYNSVPCPEPPNALLLVGVS